MSMKKPLLFVFAFLSFSSVRSMEALAGSKVSSGDHEQSSITLLITPQPPLTAPAKCSFKIFGLEWHTHTTVSWDFDSDGKPEMTGGSQDMENAEWVYKNPGTYVVTVTVSDDKGVSATTSQTIQVFEKDAVLGKLQAQWDFFVKALGQGDDGSGFVMHIETTSSFL